MTALVAGAAFWAAPAPHAVLAASTERSAAASSEAAPRAPGAASSRRTFYQWTDERGSVRFARSLDEVPAEWRDRAGQVDVDTSAFEVARPARSGAGGADASAPSQAPAAAPDVTVYTAPWCGWCRKTLAFLDERGVDYVNKDIEADERYAAELEQKSGGQSIPFVEIDGTQIRGYNPHEMAALLE